MIKESKAMSEREQEIKLKLEENQFETILHFAQNAGNVVQQELIDMYYCPKNCSYREYMSKKCLRIRRKNQKCSLDYKEIVDSIEKYAQNLVEYSTEISNSEQMSFILGALGFELAIEVKKKRYEFIYDTFFKISLDRVKDLGTFIEIEIVGYDCPYEEAGRLLEKVVNKLGLSNNPVNKEGYSNMMYQLRYGERL